MMRPEQECDAGGAAQCGVDFDELSFLTGRLVQARDLGKHRPGRKISFASWTVFYDSVRSRISLKHGISRASGRNSAAGLLCSITLHNGFPANVESANAIDAPL
jgi:hypothetical protein